MKCSKSIRKQLYDDYEKRQNEVKSQPTAWDAYKGFDLITKALDWRLWDSVKDLDLALSYVQDYIKVATKKHRTELIGKCGYLLKLENLLDQALSYINPDNWKPPRKRLMDVTLDPDQLEQALEKTEEADTLFDRLYWWITEHVEIPSTLRKQKEGWVVLTPTILSHLRNATYGIKKYLEETTKNAET